jgi:hypothetical protein
MAVQGGFVGGTLVSAMLNLPDVINARRLFTFGCIAGAFANAALPVCRGPVSFRCVSPPGQRSRGCIRPE